MARAKCVIGRYCMGHKYIHGAEAEELRAFIESLSLSRQDRAALDAIDARDSLAYLEANKGRQATRAAKRGK